MLSKEELLNPRYKVIEYYPHSAFAIGDILQRIKNATNDWYCKNGEQFELHQTNSITNIHEIVKSPAIFMELEWWEERKIEDFPEFIKYKFNGKVRPLDKTMVEYGKCVMDDYEPSTREEYGQYQQPQSKIKTMAVPITNKEYEAKKQKAKELIAAGGCFAIQFWSHTDALRLCPKEHNQLEEHLEEPVYVSGWIKSAKTAIQLIEKGINLLN